jgi:hypothetical protein
MSAAVQKKRPCSSRNSVSGSTDIVNTTHAKATIKPIKDQGAILRFIAALLASSNSIDAAATHESQTVKVGGRYRIQTYDFHRVSFTVSAPHE